MGVGRDRYHCCRRVVCHPLAPDFYLLSLGAVFGQVGQVLVNRCVERL
jgi:hypothetical protein